MLVEGTTTPTEYKLYIESKSAIEGWWGDGDTLHIEADGRVWEERNNRFVDLTMYDSMWAGNYEGYKLVGFKLDKSSKNYYKGINCLKYDNTILNVTNNISSADQCYFQSGNDDKDFYLSIADNDSGWGESYTPTADEIIAYFNGWVMKEDNASLYNGTGNKRWLKRYQGSGTSIELTFDALVEDGTSVSRCPTEKAYDDQTKVYKLYYELAEPIIRELITENGISTHSGEKCTFV